MYIHGYAIGTIGSTNDGGLPTEFCSMDSIHVCFATVDVVKKRLGHNVALSFCY